MLPINIINEKIYVFLWFWFGILSVLTFINILWSFGIVFMAAARRTIIKRKLRTRSVIPSHIISTMDGRTVAPYSL